MTMHVFFFWMHLGNHAFVPRIRNMHSNLHASILNYFILLKGCNLQSNCEKYTGGGGGGGGGGQIPPYLSVSGITVKVVHHHCRGHV